MPAAAWQVMPDGVRLCVRVTPNAARDAIAGIATLADGSAALKVRLRAPPQDGRANAALIALLARRLSLRRSDLSLAGGPAARLKTIIIAGEPPAIIARLKALAG